jgi:hypothetical protein
MFALSTLMACGSEDLGGATDTAVDAGAVLDQAHGDLGRDTAPDRAAQSDDAPHLDSAPDAVAYDAVEELELDTSLREGATADGADSEASRSDAMSSDAEARDASAPDSPIVDVSSPDSGVTDTGSPDARVTDASGSTEGGARHTPCTRGPGWVAWRFHYNANEPGTQAHLDVYELPDSSNWEANPVFSTSIVDSIHGGGLEVASGNWVLIRYSVAGITAIRSATFSVYGRSYDVSASGSFNAWTPLYGDAPSPTNSVSNAWPYEWTSIDFTGHVRAGDAPGLTGIRLYSGPSSNDLAIHAVELCVDAD